MQGCCALWEGEITDFFTLGSLNNCLGVQCCYLLRFKRQLETRYELKYGGMLGPDRHDVQDATILNRLIHYDASNQETTWPTTCADLGTARCENGQYTTRGVSHAEVVWILFFSGDKTSRYRSLTVRAIYLAMDRPDIAHSVTMKIKTYRWWLVWFETACSISLRTAQVGVVIYSPAFRTFSDLVMTVDARRPDRKSVV